MVSVQSKNVTLGYFDLNKKTYLQKSFPGSYEVIALNGNISMTEENPFFHIHVALSDPNMQVVGGHLISGKVAVTLEIYLKEFDMILHRKPDPLTGLKLWDLIGE
jgi:hypothetical protein